MKRLSAVLILGVISAQSLGAAVTFDSDALTQTQRAELKQILNDALSAQNLPSIVAAATVGDRVIWAEGVGFADMTQKVRPNPSGHLYRWASVSKVATERISQHLEEQGLVDQDAPISQYINVEEPSFLRRCFDSDAVLQKFLTCTKNYGGFGPVQMMTGFPRCFNPSTLKATKLEVGTRTFQAQVKDETLGHGKVVYTNSQGKMACSATYKTNKAFVSAQKVTLNNLLSHRAGILHYDFLGLEGDPDAALIADAKAVSARKTAGVSQMEWAIGTFYPRHPLIFLPNSGEHYSPFGYNLAGVVLEKAAGKPLDKIVREFAWRLGALSMQADYLGLKPEGQYIRAKVYRLQENKFQSYAYSTDNSYKLAGGGIMSTVVDLGRFCVGISQDRMVTKHGRSSYSHSGSHPRRSKAYLSLKTASKTAQCLVLMTNTEHEGVDLPALKGALESKLIAQKIWGKE